MEPIEYDKMREFEDRYWWYGGLRDLTARTARRVLGDGAGKVVLDAGCGTGGMTARLERDIPGIGIVGADISTLALDLSRKQCPGASFVQASVTELPFADGHFDLVVCLDVIYFKGIDEARAFSEFYRVLKRGGTLLLNVPAFEVLRGEHDRAVDGVRRYVKQDIRRSAESAGFSVGPLFYWNNILFPFLLCWRRLTGLTSRHRTARSDLRRLPGPVDRALSRYLAWEIRVAERWGLPYGSSLFGVFQKPGQDPPGT